MVYRAGLSSAHCGILAVDLETGRLVLECNPKKLFVPASTIKLITTYAALLEFGPDFRFETRLLARRSEMSESVASELLLQGSGDPFLLDSAWGDEYPHEWRALIDRVAAAGISRVDGPVIGDGSLFGSDLIPRFWEYRDLDFYHGPPVSALNAGHNVFRLVISAGPGVGLPAEVAAWPDLGDYYRIENRVETAYGHERGVWIRRSRDDGSLVAGGAIGMAVDSQVLFCTVANPPRYAANWFSRALGSNGIDVRDGASVSFDPGVAQGMELIGTVQSGSLAEIIQRVNKESDNLGAECLLRMFTPQDTESESDSAAIERLLKKLIQKGLPTEPPIGMVDGSGLSRVNLVAPVHLVWLLMEAFSNDVGRPWIESLALAGTDAILGGHPISDQLPGKVLAKTGSMTSTHCLAGYYLDGRGEPIYAFAVMTNGLSGSHEAAIELERLVIYRLRELAVQSELREPDL